MTELWRRILWIAQMLCTVALGIGLVALSGYASSYERLYHWNSSSVGMAIPTAVAVSSLGLSLFSLIEYVKRRNGKRPNEH